MQIENKKEINVQFGQGFFFGWTFGLGFFLATFIAAFIIKVLNAVGFSFFSM